MFSSFDLVTHIFLIIKTYVAILAIQQHYPTIGTYNEAYDVCYYDKSNWERITVPYVHYLLLSYIVPCTVG